MGGTIVAVLVLVITVLSAAMIPGGPFEKRNFSQNSTTRMAVYNILLTALGLSGMLLIFPSYTGQHWAFAAAGLLGVVYVVLSILDLKNIFPKSPDQRTQLMRLMEIAGLISAVLLVIFAMLGYISQH